MIQLSCFDFGKRSDASDVAKIATFLCFSDGITIFADSYEPTYNRLGGSSKAEGVEGGVGNGGDGGSKEPYI